MNNNHASKRVLTGFRASVLLMATALLFVIWGQAASANSTSYPAPGYYKSAAKGLSAAVRKEAVGIYQGQADSHTVEITVYGEPIDLQFGEALEARVEKLEEGTKVVFTYTEQKVKGDNVVRFRRLLTINEAEK
ncbi:hypothetical protein [Paenibacillus rhizophilus]|uniref:DUF3221 domain-containing protein n=1 Tax=Paenibacillus rhizophilus TaxID=1850366 RepID=A0A3N9Q8A3_9BACL|nr:hypothetical protein [Paenibacillus rhizophilus]RQW13756.1 hypothetical protein EH198_05010 [Paenibacillus rhizophilus]